MFIKKLLKLKLLFGVILIGSLFSSCANEQEKVDSKLDAPQITVTRTDSENPLEYIGEYHNASLELVDNLSLDNPELTHAEAFHEVLEALQAQPEFEGQEITYTYEQYITDFYNEDGMPYTPQEKIELLLDEGQISQEVADLTLQVYDLFEGDEKTEDEVFNAIDDIEREALGMELTNTEELVVFGAASLAKNSLNYWLGNYHSFAGGTPLTAEMIEMRMCGFGCWACVVAFDAFGALAGIPGGPAGIIIGGALMSAFARCCICSTCRRTTCPF